jgi:hypothetical protein
MVFTQITLGQPLRRKGFLLSSGIAFILVGFL